MNPSAPSHRVLLIDDEPLARLELRRLLRAHPQVEVVGEAGTMNDARTLLSQPGYDLVFLDIQLRGGNGFDLLDSTVPGAHVVFVTAYDRYAVRAFEVNALDYLLKPVTAARLASALERLERSRAHPESAAAPNRLSVDDRVFVKTSTASRFVHVSSLAAIKTCENYTELLLDTGERLLVLRALKTWEEILPEERFVRVHRQSLVNLAHIRKIVRTGEDDVLCELTPPLPAIPASRRQVAELRARFSASGVDWPLP
jgi:two-component system, LytTR family, response regulator